MFEGANRNAIWNKEVYRGLTQNEICARKIFANRRISVDKESNRSRKANYILSFGEYPYIQRLDRRLKMHGYEELERWVKTLLFMRI